jgi:hypothetical protein
MTAVLTRDAVGYAAFPLLYTQADMDAAVLASASSIAVATFTQREINNAVARARLLSSSSSGGANLHTSEHPDPLAYCRLHAHTGHWGINCSTLKKRRCEDRTRPAVGNPRPSVHSLHHWCTRQHLHRSGAVGQVGQTLPPVPRQRICEA